MSDILIRGMEMPKTCDECRIMTYEDTNCMSVHELFCGCPIVFRAQPQHEEHRPDYCPLVELLPHGDLIDRDKLEKDIDKYIGSEESRSRFHHWVQVQDAVIPMDKGEEK